MLMWIWIAIGVLVLLAVLEEVIYYVLNKQLGLERESKIKKLSHLWQKGIAVFKRKKEHSSQSA
ncbi:hypothetical protein FZC84_08845 [Rossellomorea vietnamensis]|uniref:Uncharacterized protein n=1 Tax=Rossellomorea vietnamensis TaxID=218284 RepID=A0A5D4MFX0_9BACI|nr:hypothetical protein [Rossellomorea vietnamensis]TYR99910.1 hypothetical protein FZC84_08845 [Rossellomorea vietnamensis]